LVIQDGRVVAQGVITFYEEQRWSARPGGAAVGLHDIRCPGFELVSPPKNAVVLRDATGGF